MKYSETDLPGCFEIEPERHGDSRGFFARVFCAEEFAANSLNPVIAQASFSFNAKKGTLRGLHFQRYPQTEDKLVRCVRGAIFDVMVDLRRGSPTFGRWYGKELSEDNGLQLYSCKGFAHGFQTLTDDCVVSYHIGQPYDGASAVGIRWDDPDIDVAWPDAPVEQSPRDLSLPFLKDIDPTSLEPFAQ